MEAAGDHEVEDQPEVTFNTNGDAFADAAEGGYRAAFCGGQGWVDGAEEEDGGDADAVEGLAEDARLEGADVGGDVGKFRHLFKIAARRADFAMVLAKNC